MDLNHAGLLRQPIGKVLELVLHVTEAFSHEPLDGIHGTFRMSRELFLRGIAHLQPLRSVGYDGGHQPMAIGVRNDGRHLAVHIGDQRVGGS